MRTRIVMSALTRNIRKAMKHVLCFLKNNLKKDHTNILKGLIPTQSLAFLRYAKSKERAHICPCPSSSFLYIHPVHYLNKLGSTSKDCNQHHRINTPTLRNKLSIVHYMDQSAMCRSAMCRCLLLHTITYASVTYSSRKD